MAAALPHGDRIHFVRIGRPGRDPRVVQGRGRGGHARAAGHAQPPTQHAHQAVRRHRRRRAGRGQRPARHRPARGTRPAAGSSATPPTRPTSRAPSARSSTPRRRSAPPCACAACGRRGRATRGSTRLASCCASTPTWASRPSGAHVGAADARALPARLLDGQRLPARPGDRAARPGRGGARGPHALAPPGARARGASQQWSAGHHPRPLDGALHRPRPTRQPPQGPADAAGAAPGPAAGMRVVWTAHDLFRHDRRGGPRGARLHARASSTSRTPSSCTAGRPQMAWPPSLDLAPAARAKVHVIPHGHYRGAYPDTIVARRRHARAWACRPRPGSWRSRAGCAPTRA